MGKRVSSVLTRPPHREHALSSPRGDVFAPPPPGRQLPVRQTPTAAAFRPAWLFVAAHGGSGATLLARLSWQDYEAAAKLANSTGQPLGEYAPYGMPAGRAWPNPALEPTGDTIMVCRTTMHGLAWARDAAAQYLSGRTPPGLRLLGVVTVADQPGRLPQPLAAAKGLLGGVFPHTWHVPYVPEYRLYAGLTDEDCPPLHPAVEDVLAAIRSTVIPKGPRA